MFYRNIEYFLFCFFMDIHCCIDPFLRVKIFLVDVTVKLVDLIICFNLFIYF